MKHSTFSVKKKKKFRVDTTKLGAGDGLQYSRSYGWIKESPAHERPYKPC